MKVTVDLRNDSTDDWAPDATLCSKWIRAALDAALFKQDNSVSLSFVTEQTAAELNAKYRGKTAATNVLSFASEFPDNLTSAISYKPLGDLVICPYIVAREASEQKKQLEAHWAHLTTHGILHLLGYDHAAESDRHAMEQLEINALLTLGISDPYVPHNN